MQEDWKVRFFLRDCGTFIVGTVSDGCRLQLTFLVLGLEELVFLQTQVIF